MSVGLPIHLGIHTASCQSAEVPDLHPLIVSRIPHLIINMNLSYHPGA